MSASLPCLTALAGALLQAPSGWTEHELHPEGDPEVLLCDDLDGDGDRDLLLIDGRRVSVFFWSEQGLPEQPDHRFELPADTVFTDLGDLNGDRARELVLLTPSGIQAVGFTGGKADAPRKVEQLACDEIFLYEVPAEDVGWNDVLLDLDGRGEEDALVPTLSGYRIFFRSDDPTRFTPGGVVPVMPTGSLSFSDASDLGVVEQTIDMPRIFAGDVSGDGRFEILTFDGTAVRAFAPPDSPSDSPGAPGATDVRWELLFERVLYASSASLTEEYLSSRNVRLEDLDGGGASSLLVVRSLDGEIDFFSTGEDGPLCSRRTLRLEDWVLPPKLIDLDGDGRLDLLAPTIEAVGYLRLMKIFASQSYQMRYSIFRNRDRVRYTRTPDEVREITFPLEYETSETGVRIESRMIYSFDADFDGDGIKDFLVKLSPTELTVYRGQPGASFAREPAERIAISDTAGALSIAVRTWDLDLDGRSEILLHYEGKAGSPHRYRWLTH